MRGRDLWGKTRNDRPMPLDPTPSPTGNIRLTDGIVEIVVSNHYGEDLYTSHFASCPEADAHRRR